MYLNRDMDGGPFLVYFLPILGGQKATVLNSVEGWCVAGNLRASKVSIRMDDRTDGQTDDGKRMGQKAAMSDSVEGWCATGNLGASRVSIRMDDQTDGQTDDGMNDGQIQGKLHFIPTSFNICNGWTNG